jgi:hypothetical protein
MRHCSRLGIVLLVLCPVAYARPVENSALPLVAANDNTTPAGQFTNGILNLRLELRQARWYPEEEKGEYRDIYAFAEEGRRPQSSGPLIRVPRGTHICAVIRNMLALPAKIYGLHQHPGNPKDAVRLEPGEARQLEFVAGEPDTYMYWATTSDNRLEDRDGAETLLSGAFVVDALVARPNDHVFVIGFWTKEKGVPEEPIPWINGKSWPHTEHLTYNTEEAVHWRVINSSLESHAMHLHGFFFTVSGVGDGERYDPYSEEHERKGVTELIDAGHVFEMTWMPERAGNWLFHCHMASHISLVKALHPHQTEPAVHDSPHHPSAGMGGLVIGITVLPGATLAADPVVTKAPRKLQLVISENPDKIPLYKLEVKDPRVPAEPDKNASSAC